MINPNISGDFEEIDNDSVYLSSLVGANHTRSENWKWLFGVFYSNGLDDDFVVPAVGFQWAAEDSDLFFGGPIIRYNRNLTPRAKLTFRTDLQATGILKHHMLVLMRKEIYVFEHTGSVLQLNGVFQTNIPSQFLQEWTLHGNWRLQTETLVPCSKVIWTPPLCLRWGTTSSCDQ